MELPLTAPSRWNPGDTAVLRGVGFGHLWWACPAFVVEDTPERIALYWRVGTHWRDVGRHPTAQELLAVAKVDLIELTWAETDVLLLAAPGEAHSIWLMWEQGHVRLRCWYVNLETPLRRTPLGFDMMDQELDVVISADRSEWHWKDEAAFDEMVAAGVFSAEEARAIREEGGRVIRQMQAGGSPFCDGWEKWSPPPEWGIPELPPGWDDVGKE
jgi:hypothetical protein